MNEFIAIVNLITNVTGNVALVSFFMLRERVIKLEVKLEYKEDFEEETKRELKEIKELITQIRLDK